MKAYFLHESLNKDQSGMCQQIIQSMLEHGMGDVVDLQIGSDRAVLFLKQYPAVAEYLGGKRGPHLCVIGAQGAKCYSGVDIFQAIQLLTAIKQAGPMRPGPGMPIAPNSVAQPMYQEMLYGPGGDAMAADIDDTGVYATNYGLYNNEFESPNQIVATRGNKFLQRHGHLPPSARPEPLPLVRCPPWRVGNRGYPCYKDGQSLAVSDGMEVPLLAGPNNWKANYFSESIGGIYTNFGPFTTPNSFDPDVFNHPFVTAFKRGNQEQSQRQFGDSLSYRRSYLSFE